MGTVALEPMQELVMHLEDSVTEQEVLSAPSVLILL
jgi:hypothetical protein